MRASTDSLIKQQVRFKVILNLNTYYKYNLLIELYTYISRNYLPLFLIYTCLLEKNIGILKIWRINKTKKRLEKSYN